MRSTLPRALATTALATTALAAAACDRPTAIVVEVRWDDQAIEAAQGDVLRLHVGGERRDVEGGNAFRFVDAGLDRVKLAEHDSPYTFLLEPAGPLDEIGPLQLAASIVSERRTPVEVGFAAAPNPVSFVRGEVRTVALAPQPTAFASSGGGDCVLWDDDGNPGFDLAIGARADADCDDAGDDVDCAVLDPIVTMQHPVDDPEACMNRCETTGHAEVCDQIDQNCDGIPAPPLPCRTDAKIAGACAITLPGRTCDPLAGRYGACLGPGLPVRDALLCDAILGLEECIAMGADDPLACAAEGITYRCRVADPAPGCEIERLDLTFAGANDCSFNMVGGVFHEHWAIGFEPALGGPPQATAQQCPATLAARWRDTNRAPHPRTVLILAEHDAVGLAGAVVRFERGGACDGMIECTPVPFEPR